MTGRDFCQLATDLGYNFFTGVPDSTLSAALEVLERDPRFHYFSSVREDNAIGLAAGAYLGGKMPMVLMQNSGLGQSVNALTSLCLLYRIPLLLVIGWRGAEETDAPEHLLMGNALPALLKDIGIKFWIPTKDSVDSALKDAKDWSLLEETVSAVLVKDMVIE